MPTLAPVHCLPKNYFLINNPRNITVNQNVVILETLRNMGGTISCSKVLEAVMDIFHALPEASCFVTDLIRSHLGVPKRQF